ncbi:F-box/kelch-repeat protein At3g06240 [Lactuca sativa]|uniref:F-box domain-containing protein n=1 Tax=Lactuca sativa TaxID=4236 RepID=A0A9R1UT14_LACSA|nr:F-box/kelch-repeat protein At3g06240 [Lactuca sativa]KAJ0192398.1 hypothetical protein LSAT_V11C800399540 [Lactuca sativa]
MHAKKLASQQHSTTMENLPFDVLSNIFIWLFAKQLAQMRCVCKSWNAFLSKSSFIKSHLDHSIHNNDEVLLFFYGAFDIFGDEAFSAHPTRSPNLKLNDFIKPPFNLKFATVIGSVNGLICFFDESYHDPMIYIWNPSLSALSTLPPHFVASLGDSYRKSIDFRFGFDSKSDDYKVIKLEGLLQPPSFIDPNLAASVSASSFVVKEWMQVEVYSMRKGCCQLISQRFPSHITGISGEDEVSVTGYDGVPHWLGFIDEKKELQTIVAFDFGAETFCEIPLPVSMLEHKAGDVLGVLGGKLCVMSRVRDDECEVWVMDDYGVVESWVKRYTFSQFGNIVPFGFTSHNEFLFKVEKVHGDDDDDDVDYDDLHDVEYSDDCFGLYDPVAEKSKFFKLHCGITKIVGYVDSLVWMGPNELQMSISQLQI